jgi:TRAP-type transport system periplasmic protein
MRQSRRAFLASMLTSIAAPAVLRLARADAPQTTLKLHHAFSAVAAVHDKFLAPWARKVEADCGNRVRIDLFPSMQLGGAPAHLFDQARDGIADIVWATPGASPGRFPKSEAFELPFVLSHRALVNSKALADFAAANLQDEFREFHPLCFCCRDPGVLHTGRAINSIDDLKGLRLHAPNRLAGESVRALGAQGVSVPMPQVPMALSARAIDGCLDPWDAVPGLRPNDSIKHHTDFTGGALSSATFVLAMSNQAYERLPRDLKSAFDNNSGQVAADMAGAMWDLEAKAVAGAARDRGEEVVVIGGNDLTHWRKATEPVIAAWQKQMKERKIDGGKLLAEVHALVTKYADEPEPQAQQTARRPEPPSEQKIATEPPPESAQPTPEAFTRPKADAPALEAAASPPSATGAAPTVPEPPASLVTPAPPAQLAPAPVAAPKQKAFDIPL